MLKNLITPDPQTGGFVDSPVISGLHSEISYAEENQRVCDHKFPMQKEEFEKQKFIDSEVSEEAWVLLPGVETTSYGHERKNRPLFYVNPTAPIKPLTRSALKPSPAAYAKTSVFFEARATTLSNTLFYEDPREEAVWELAHKVLSVEWTRRAYEMRILRLRQLTEEEDYCLNPSSEKDFWAFFELNPFVRQGNLVLLENGNLRAVWKDGRGTQIGLQFLGGGTVQFVIFKVRTQGRLVSRVYGRDDFEGIKCQIQAFELHPMMSS